MTHCPRCQQPLPEPPTRFCPNCGYDTYAPGEPIVPGGPEVGGAYPPPPPALPPLPGGVPPPGAGSPWERRRQIGFASALVETTQQVLTSPSEFFRSMPVTGGIGGPLLYGVIAGYIGLVASALYSFILRSALGSTWSFGQGSELDRIMPMLSSGMGLVGQVVLGPLAVTIGLFLVSAVVHLCLLALGGATNGFEATFRVAAYSEAAMVIRIVPVCGDVVAIVYYVILAIIGVSEAHRISGLKAAAAVLLPFVLLCCCCGAGLLVAAGGLASLLNQVQ
jgi:hypothetical protein